MPWPGYIWSGCLYFFVHEDIRTLTLFIIDNTNVPIYQLCPGTKQVQEGTNQGQTKTEEGQTGREKGSDKKAVTKQVKARPI